MNRTARIVLVAVIAVLVAGGAAVWWFVLRSDAPPPAALPERTTTTAGGSTTTTYGGTTPQGTTADGTWQVQAATETFVGYRVDEQFAGQAITVTAAGRTPAVTGTLTVDGTEVTAAEITADVTQLRSDESRRDNAIRTRGLETDRFPQATFVLTQPIALPGPPVQGQAVQVDATGDLTLHGVTRTVTVPLQARWNGDTIDVAGSLPIAFADYAIEAPSIGGFVSVAGNGILELQLVFVPA